MLMQYESPPRTATPEADAYLRSQIEHNFRKLEHKWDPEHSLAGYEEKVWSYATRHRVERPKDLLDDRPKADENKGEEILILDRVRNEGKQRENMTSSEKATVAIIESGNRSFLDFALDEVERFKRLDSLGAVSSKFDWKICGDSHDIPPLRRSMGEHSVRVLKGDDFASAFEQHTNFRSKDPERKELEEKRETAGSALQDEMYMSTQTDFVSSFRPTSAKKRSSRKRLHRHASDPTFGGARASPGAPPMHPSSDGSPLPKNIVGKAVRVKGPPWAPWRWAIVEVDSRPKDSLLTVRWREPWPEDRSEFKVVPIKEVLYEKPDRSDDFPSPMRSTSASALSPPLSRAGGRRARPRTFEERAAESVREERLKFGMM